MESPRRTMPPPRGKNDPAEEEAPENVDEGGQDDNVDRLLTEGLRKLYDPILEEEVPAEMIEILRRRRKRS